jgi:hypothetical protein
MIRFVAIRTENGMHLQELPERKAMRYFACITDGGIKIRGKSDRSEFRDPEKWREVLNIRRHVNEIGIDVLNHDMAMYFTTIDQSYCELLLLFYSE